VVGYPAPVAEYEPHLISCEELGSDELVKSTRRMVIRVAEGLDVYGILLLPYRENPRLMFCFHGGSGCPELVTSVCPSNNYNDGARRFVKLGFAVFAPLLVLHREETIDPDWNENYRIAMNINAMWAGTSVLAIELLKIERAMRFFDGYDGVDASAIGIAGLSYGGYYALYASALIERTAFCVSSCYFNDRLTVMRDHPYGLLDWQYPNAGSQYGDAHLAALICPKPLYIEAGERDELFSPEGARREAQLVREVYDACGAKFLFDVFEGKHEFGLRHIDGFLKAETEERKLAK
jgi:dienelactone hydrolase